MWPGLELMAIFLGLVLVPLGLWQAFTAGLGSVPAVRLTTWDMAAAAAALSILTGWRWSRASAELSLSLWTTALAAHRGNDGNAGSPPTVVDRGAAGGAHGGVVGLTCASVVWFWLASFWRQQLRDGRAWTTAGRLIPLAERVGFLATALAVLVGAKLAIWPRMPYGSADNSAARLATGSVTYILLIGMCLYAATRVGKMTMLWLAGLAGTTYGAFLWLRW